MIAISKSQWLNTTEVYFSVMLSQLQTQETLDEALLQSETWKYRLI